MVDGKPPLGGAMREEYIVNKASLPLGESLVERSLFNRALI
jgi:hypothetical protein